MNSVYDYLQQSLSSHQWEMVDLARELRQRFNASREHMMNTSESLHGLIEKLSEESKRLGSNATKIDEVQTKCITEFSGAYEEQSRADAQKLIADVTTLVSDCMRRYKETVDARLGDLNNSVIGK
ncbi:P-loop containing nucleoside triphosphate hydrolases superfamily protein [Salvia divinorum]|uniref:P-loop containing nucleoside triphosphate hydrolases superfamily protein n=1 Tax=Salvia divinorum TaxID=28513 RepID=A0ABD1GS46_SALDI